MPTATGTMTLPLKLENQHRIYILISIYNQGCEGCSLEFSSAPFKGTVEVWPLLSTREELMEDLFSMLGVEVKRRFKYTHAVTHSHVHTHRHRAHEASERTVAIKTDKRYVLR